MEPVTYLLDTDVVVDHIRGKNIIALKVAKMGVAISIISLGELLYGAYKSNHLSKGLLEIENTIQLLSIRIQDLDRQVMEDFAQIKTDLEKKGQRLEDFDILIAATAKANSLKLVTKNLKHFQRIPGLEVA